MQLKSAYSETATNQINMPWIQSEYAEIQLNEAVIKKFMLWHKNSIKTVEK